jgi:hypothetical protein
MYSFEETKYLCFSSLFITISSIVLFYLQKYVLSFLMFVLSVTSINHWRRFELGGWRQSLDLAWVNVCGLYGLLDSFCGTEFQQCLFLSMIYCVWIFYKISQTCCRQWVIFHTSIHIYVAFFIPLLYLL